MSAAPRTLLRTSLMARMEKDFPLAALLARDPSYPLRPAIFNARKNDAPPVYPCVTYRIAGDRPDARFGAEPGEETVDSAPVTFISLEIEAWTNLPDSGPIEDIAARLDALFDRKAWDIPGLGRVFKSAQITSQPDLYDKTLNANFGLFLYHLQLQKDSL